MKTPFLGASYLARSPNAAADRCINLYPEAIPQGGKEPGVLYRCPGLSLLATVGSGPIRGLWQLGQYGYVVSGNTLYKIDSTWAATTVGTVTGSGPVSMDDNGTQLFVACNPDGFIYNSLTDVFAQITDPDFPGASVVQYLDGFFTFLEPNSQRFWVTALLDGTSIDPLDYASAEGAPDGLVSMIVDHRELWLMGSESVEVWYNAGEPDFPFARIQGAFIEQGCAAPFSVAKMDNSVFWLGSDARGDGIVWRANGYTPQRVSTHAIEYAISTYPIISDAIAYTYQQDGHSFYVLTFPSGSATWVFDAATNLWHQRASFNQSTGQFYRHRSNAHMFFNGQTVVGDFENGNLYSMNLSTYADNGAAQKWLKAWRALGTGQNNLDRTFQHSLQIDGQTGVGLVTGTTQPVLTISGFSAAANTLTVTNTYVPNDRVQYLPTTSVIGGLTSGAAYYVLTATSTTITLSETEGGAVVDLTGVTGDGTLQLLLESNPQAVLRFSDDGGHTWSNEMWRSMGKIGQTGTRVIYRRLGSTEKLRDRVYELSGVDPVKIAFTGAKLIASQGSS